MCQEKISRLLKKYGDSFDKVFFKAIENIVGPGKTDVEILKLAKAKPQDRKISSIRNSGHIISDKVIERWFKYLGAAPSDVDDIKLCAEYFRNLKKASNLKIEGNPMFEKPIYIDSGVPIGRPDDTEDVPCIDTPEITEPEVRALPLQSFEDLNERLYEAKDITFKKFVHAIQVTLDDENIEWFSERFGLSLEWFDKCFREGLVVQFQNLAEMRRFFSGLMMPKQLEGWILDYPTKKRKLELYVEWRAHIKPPERKDMSKEIGSSSL